MTNSDVKEISNSDLLLNANEIDRDAIFSRLNTLHMLHHIQLSGIGPESGHGGGKDLIGSILSRKKQDHHENDGLTGSLETTIDIAENFYSFLVENRMALDEVKSNINALVFGRISDIADMWEEYATKEDPMKDTLMQMVPFLLSTFSEKSYVSSAEIGLKGILRTYSLYIYSAIYSYLKDTRKLADEKEAENISRTMEELHTALDTAIGNPRGLYLFAVMFLLIYNLRAQEILNMLNHEPEKMNTEV